MDCYNGITIPTPTPAPCDGNYTSTECVATPSAIPAIDVEAGATQAAVNTALANALIYKEEQIQNIIEDIQPFTERKIFRGAFFGSAFISTAEDTINDLVIENLSTGVYELASGSLTISTSIVITPNSIASGYDDITISYDYSNVLTGSIIFKIKNNGTLVNLLESPIKVEI